ncbi:MAG: T9SS type A sorting domain-containing protein [Bacteroidota bacterium]
MKTRFLLLFALLMSTAIGLQAQINVTLQVDMAEQAVLSSVNDTISVAGSFQAAAGFPADWTPGVVLLTDTTAGDSIYTVTFNLPAGSYEYKFLNGPAWGTDESAPNDCSPSNNGNRGLDLTGFAGTDTILPVVCFAKCGDCENVSIPDTVEVTFFIDMSNEDIADTVSIAGNFQAPAGFPSNFAPGETVMTDTMGGVADSIYELKVTLPEGTYKYKVINGTEWGFAENVPNDCNVGGDREMVIVNDGSMMQTIGPFCFAECEANCPAILPPIMVTFRVDMNNEILSDSGVFAAGNMQDPSWLKNRDKMTDPDGDGIYEFTYEILRGEYEFKFFNGANGDPGSDEFSETGDFFNLGCGNGGFGNNRWVDISNAVGDTVLPVWQYNTCDRSFATSIDNDLKTEVGFKAFPNPANTVLNLSVDLKRIEQIEMLDMSGRTIRRQGNINNTTYQLERGSLAPGLYILKVRIDGNDITQKVMFE